MTNGLFPISAVSAATGVNSITLRAWERRYGLINPSRTDTGHRLYSEDDIATIRQILQLIGEGVAISRVKQALSVNETTTSEPAPSEGPWAHYRENMLRGVAQFDETVLEATYNEVMSLYPVDVVTRQLLLPLLEQLGQRWQSEVTGIAEEHFFSVYMRNKLGARFHHRNAQNTGPRLVAACLPGEHHEFGLLLFSLAAHSRGYRIVLLGADLPISQIPAVVERTQSEAVVLSGSVEYDPQTLSEELKMLQKNCKAPVYVGGTCAQQYGDRIKATGAVPLGADLSSSLHLLNSQLPTTQSQA